MQHLFFHGPSGAGKSFAIARAAAEAGVTPAGFRSRKAADGAVYLGPAAGPFPLDAAHRVANVAVRPPVCDAARFDALGTALLASVRSGDFVLMDEIGFLERDAAAFSRRVLALLERTDIRIIGVCRADRDTPLLMRLRAHERVALQAVAPDAASRAGAVRLPRRPRAVSGASSSRAVRAAMRGGGVPCRAKRPSGARLRGGGTRAGTHSPSHADGAACAAPSGFLYFSDLRRAAYAPTICAVALAPMRVAPAASIRSASSRVRTPPDAFTPMSGPTVARIRRTSASVAPPVEKPVDVLTNAAPAAFAARQARRFCPSVSRHVSRMTFTGAGAAAATTAAISACTASHSSPRARPTFMTISISCAPAATAARASNALASAAIAPSGKPTTQHVLTPLPASACAAAAAQQELTHTLAARSALPSAHARRMSARVASGLSRVWSILAASS